MTLLFSKNFTSLNNDMLLYILEYVPLSFYINKEFYKIRKMYLDKYVDKIKKWFRYHSIYYINITEDMKITKKLLVKFYVFDYPKKFLLDYPEFLTKKCFNINRNHNRNDTNLTTIQKEILNKLLLLQNDINDRKTYDIYQFLKSPYITKDIIDYAGW